MYAPERAIGEPLPLGTFEMRRGENIVFLHVDEADPRAKGQGMDLLELIFEKR